MVTKWSHIMNAAAALVHWTREPEANENKVAVVTKWSHIMNATAALVHWTREPEANENEVAVVDQMVPHYECDSRVGPLNPRGETE